MEVISMELQTISQVSKTYGVSVRMLRYYEREGLIESKRKEDYAYRVYDETAIKRLQQIIILRKLQIPVKQISAILENPDVSVAIELFQQNISELDDEITALSTIKSILKALVDILKDKIKSNFPLDLTSDTSILPLIESLSFTKNKIKENLSMEELNKANETLNRINKPKIFTFKTQLDEFLFLGFEQAVTKDTDFGAVWDNFFKMSEKVGFGNYEQIIWYYKNNEQIYFVGKIVEHTEEVPEGFSLVKFPACEYMVVTHEWTSDANDGNFLTQDYIGIGQTHNYKDNIPMLDGYVRYDGSDSPITQIEIENSNKDGSRFERWVPIKKA